MCLFYSIMIGDSNIFADCEELSLPSPYPFVSPIGTEIFINCEDYVENNGGKPDSDGTGSFSDNNFFVEVTGYIDNFNDEFEGPCGFLMLLAPRNEGSRDFHIRNGKLIREYLKTQGWK